MAAPTPDEQQASVGAIDSGLGITVDKPDESGNNKFQSAISAWRALNLTSLVRSLDTTAEDLLVHQKDSLVQRKELAQKTKDFRKLDDDGKLNEIKDLLKSYQTYIDALTNNSKAVQSAFMQAYTPLAEAPDPYPLLEASIDALITADEVLPRLEGENAQLQTQIVQLTTAVEDGEKQLEAERAKRQDFEGGQEGRVKEVEESWRAVLEEKEGNWQAKEKSLEVKVENQERLLREVKASYEVAQRLEKSGDSGDGGRNTASAVELEIVTSELEKSNIRLAELESRNEQLRVELAQTAGQTHRNAPSNIEDDPSYLRLRSENSSLLRKLESARFSQSTAQTSLETQIKGLEREIASLKTDRDALQAKIQKYSDYNEVKRELDMLRAIEFSSIDDTTSTADAGEATSNGTREMETLEHLLLARNKKLSNEVTEFRVSHNELSSQLSTLSEDLSVTNAELEKARNLNAELENDLQKTQQEASNAFETMSVVGTYTSRHPGAGGTANVSTYGSRRGGGAASPTSSIIGGFEPNPSPSLHSLRAGEPVGGGSGILPMITAQRDRFKTKISELELELQKQHKNIASLRGEIASLQKDNLNLYEKTRFVHNYPRTQPTASGASYGASPTSNPTTITMDGDNTDSRYRSAYESSLLTPSSSSSYPLSSFRSRESARALKRMTLPERVVWQVTRMVLATRTSRNLFAVYCLGLHLLVLGMLYWMGTGEIEQSASNLGGAAVAAGAAAAAGKLGSGGSGDAAGGGRSAGGLKHGEWQPEGFQAGGAG